MTTPILLHTDAQVLAADTDGDDEYESLHLSDLVHTRSEIPCQVVEFKTRLGRHSYPSNRVEALSQYV